jgi:RNA 2',3'-cyclic 3'-phosphodiesterase
LFFALWPPEKIRKALARLARDLPRRRGRPMPAVNLHITLAFAGAVGADVQDCLHAWAVAIEAQNFELSLARIGCFSRSRIIWLGADACPAALAYLARRLNEGLESCGIRPNSRAYRPHITLLRDAEPASRIPEVAAIVWQVENFYLVESHTKSAGAQYHLLQRYDLRGEA